ncbi:MAG: chorismate-binding protein, partial [Acidobacteria bacterium]|nr:chorismate-binding protein [Acidobacteriota bacterium]
MSASTTLGDRPFLELPAADEAARHLQRALRDNRRPGQPLVVVLPAPDWPIESAAGVLPPDHGLLWSSRGTALDRELATSGRALRIEADEGGLGAAARSVEALWGRLRIVRHAEAAPFVPLLVGGLAFAPGRTPGAWAPFGGGHFDLPRWSFVPSALALALDGTEGEPDEHWIDSLRAIAARRAARPVGDHPRIVAREGLGRAAWRTLVEEIRSGIESGTFAKIVLARRETVTAAQPIDPVAVYAQLARARHDGPSFRFCFREATAAFVGLSPERLVEIDGATVTTEAVAGSSHGGAGVAAGPLLASAKDRAEHAIVVEAIRRRLAPLCSELVVAATPEVRRLEHVSHLVTAIRGRIARAAAPLEWVELLHPTPSVGGDPSGAALTFLAAREPAARGWYAG